VGLARTEAVDRGRVRSVGELAVGRLGDERTGQTGGRHRGSGGEAWNSGAELELGDRVIGRSACGRDRHGVGGQAEVFEDVCGDV